MDYYTYKKLGKNVTKKLFWTIFPISLFIVLLTTTSFVSASVITTYHTTVKQIYVTTTIYEKTSELYGYLRLLWFLIPIPVGAAFALEAVFIIIGFLAKPLVYGEKVFYMYTFSYDEGKDPEPGTGICFKAAVKNYKKFLKAAILTWLKVLGDLFTFYREDYYVHAHFPIVTKYFSYYLVPYIVGTHPDIEINTAQDLSEQYMEGNRWALFTMQFSFIGWELLNILTAGILKAVWLRGYEQASIAAFVTSLEIDYYGTGVEENNNTVEIQ